MNTTTDITTIERELAETRARLEILGKKLEETRVALRVAARGTGDHTEASAAASKAATVPTALAPRIAFRLAERPHGLSELVLDTGASAKRILGAIPVGAVNVGSDKHPIWTMPIGDEGDTQSLIAAVERLISLRPFTLQELSDVTGARRNRISGALVKIQVRGSDGKGGRKVENHGSQKIARWYAPPAKR